MLEFLTAHLPEKFFLDTSDFIKNRKGFTLVELVVVIAIIGILAGIAIPRFMEATASARGAKIVADMRTIESAVIIYYAKEGKYPASEAKDTASATSAGFLGENALLTAWPVPPVGTANIKYANDPGSNVVNVQNGAVYTYTPATADGKTGYTITMDGQTLEQLQNKTTSGGGGK